MDRLKAKLAKRGQPRARGPNRAKMARDEQLLRGRNILSNVPYQVPHDYRTGRGDRRVEHRGNAQAVFAPGMFEVADVVANRNKDIRFVPRVSHFEGAQQYVATKPGWNAYQEDIIGDSSPEVFITDNRGNIRYLNGYTTKQSNLPMNRAHNKMNLYNAETGRKIPKKMIRELANQYVVENGAVKYANQFPEEFLPYIEPLRKEITAKRVFEQLVFRLRVDAWIQDGSLGWNDLPPIGRARLLQMLLRNCFQNIIDGSIYEDLGLKNNENNRALFNKIRNTKDFENTRKEYVMMAYNNPDQNLNNAFNRARAETITELFLKMYKQV